MEIHTFSSFPGRVGTLFCIYNLQTLTLQEFLFDAMCLPLQTKAVALMEGEVEIRRDLVDMTESISELHNKYLRVFDHMTVMYQRVNHSRKMTPLEIGEAGM